MAKHADGSDGCNSIADGGAAVAVGYIAASSMATVDGAAVAVNLPAEVLEEVQKLRQQVRQMAEAQRVPQPVLRLTDAPQEVDPQKKNNAAVSVQKRFRGFFARKKVKEHKAAVALQKRSRGFFARRRAKKMREEKAAVPIQTRYRSILGRRQADKRRKQTSKAVLPIQSRFRGRKDRKRVQKLKEQRAKELKRKNSMIARARRSLPFKVTRRSKDTNVLLTHHSKDTNVLYVAKAKINQKTLN